MRAGADLRASVEAYERRLRRRSHEAASAEGDRSLAALHRRIAVRRSRRSRALTPAGPAGAADGAPADDGADDPTSGPPGQLLAVRQHGPTVRVLRVGRPAGLGFAPGQHVKVGTGGRRRSFSIASAPHEPHLELAVELRPGGVVTPALFALPLGATLDVGDTASGDLRLDGAAAHHLMVATVTGIAPLRSMLLDALHRGVQATFTVLHGASLAHELPFRDELAALAEADERVDYVPAVSRPDDPANAAWRGVSGRVDALARRVAEGRDPATTAAYAVGNAGMVATVARELGDAGLRVATESYGG